MHRMTLACFPFLLAAPLLAQPQIGGGTCNSASLNGTYSLSLTGRDLSSAVAFSNVLQGIGTAAFDGLSKVTFTLTNNTQKQFGVAETLSGTYSMQANCIGVVNITSGDTATFTLGSFDQAAEGVAATDFFVDGQDGVYSFLGNGSLLPASACTASLLSGTYAFNGNGFALAANAISGVNSISGLMQFDGTSAITTNWYVSTSGSSTNTTTSGSYTVTAGCTATATVTDPSGNSYTLVFTVTFEEQFRRQRRKLTDHLYRKRANPMTTEPILNGAGAHENQWKSPDFRPLCAGQPLSGAGADHACYLYERNSDRNSLFDACGAKRPFHGCTD